MNILILEASLVKCVVWANPSGRELAGDEDGHHHPVDGDDTRHDDLGWKIREKLDKMWIGTFEISFSKSNSLTGMMLFMMASGRITAIAAIPVPDFAVPYAAPIAGMRNIFNFVFTHAVAWCAVHDIDYR